jgi:hypothetical protein
MVLAILLALICGTQLWSKKILTDPGAAAALAPAPITGTIAQLGGFPRTHKSRLHRGRDHHRDPPRGGQRHPRSSRTPMRFFITQLA